MADWHPICAAVEDPPGTWRMVDPMGRDYGRVDVRRTPDGIRYRVEFRGEVIGWATSLRLACERVHQRYLRAHGPSGGPAARWE